MMKQYPRQAESGTRKTDETTDQTLQAVQTDTVAQWLGEADQRPESPAPPPVWTRYIDSRLKQFCVR